MNIDCQQCFTYGCLSFFSNFIWKQVHRSHSPCDRHHSGIIDQCLWTQSVKLCSRETQRYQVSRGKCWIVQLIPTVTFYNCLLSHFFVSCVLHVEEFNIFGLWTVILTVGVFNVYVVWIFETNMFSAICKFPANHSLLVYMYITNLYIVCLINCFFWNTVIYLTKKEIFSGLCL